MKLIPTLHQLTRRFVNNVVLSCASGIATILVAVFATGNLHAATLPSGFSETTVPGPSGGNWSEAVGILFEDNGRMYVWERAGKVWIKEYGANTWSLLLDI